MTSTTMVAASVLPTPPSSPSHSSRKPVFTPTASTAAVLATFSSNDPQLLSQSKSTSIANATLTTTTISLPRTTAPRLAAAESTPPRTIAVLKTDLCIINWRCGAQTRTNTECQRYILQSNKELIDSQLMSMTGLTRASPDYEPALLKLVMLVHCHQHNAGPPKERRLEAWRLTFPLGSADGSEREAPLVQRIRKALGTLSVECIARDDSCTHEGRIGGQKMQNCERTLQELVKQDIYSSDAKLELLLKVLEWNRTCSNHQSSRQFIRFAAWKKSVMAVLPLLRLVIDPAIVNNTPNEPQISPRARTSLPIITTLQRTENEDLVIMQTHALPSPQASTDPTINVDTDPASYWTKAYDTSPFDILAHSNPLASLILSYKLIRTKIVKQLNAEDLHDGYMYAYEVDGNNGYVKIGYTKRSVTDRLDEWSFDCNRRTRSLYPPPAAADVSSGAAATAVATPHARRIEALCHAELHRRRIKIYCGACLKQHVEWFDVSTSEVLAVIQKWSRWIATRPYELLQLRSGPKWVLKSSEVQRTLRIEQFMRELVVVPASLGREGEGG